MKKEINPAIFWVALVVVIAIVAYAGWRYTGSSYKVETKGSEESMQRVQEGQPLYQPPANAPVPRPPQGGAGGGGGGMYNLQPPPR
jgi:hypothetical protein